MLTRFLRLHGLLACTQDKLIQDKVEMLEERRSHISLSTLCSCHLQHDHSSHWIALTVVSVHTSSPSYTNQLLVNSYWARGALFFHEKQNNLLTFSVKCLKVYLTSSDSVKYNISDLQNSKQKRNVLPNLLPMVLENQSLLRKSFQQYRLFELLTIMSNSLQHLQTDILYEYWENHGFLCLHMKAKSRIDFYNQVSLIIQ